MDSTDRLTSGTCFFSGMSCSTLPPSSLPSSLSVPKNFGMNGLRRAIGAERGDSLMSW